MRGLAFPPLDRAARLARRSRRGTLVGTESRVVDAAFHRRLRSRIARVREVSRCVWVARAWEPENLHPPRRRDAVARHGARFDFATGKTYVPTSSSAVGGG